MQMNFTLILSQSVSKFDMGNCVMFYDVFMKWEGPQQLLKVWFCKLKVFMWILTCMLYVSIVVTYIFTVNEFSITKTNFSFSCKIKKSDISNSLCCRFFSSQFILFLPGSFLTTVGNFSLTYKVKIIIISLRDFSFLRCFNDFFLILGSRVVKAIT